LSYDCATMQHNRFILGNLWPHSYYLEPLWRSQYILYPYTNRI